MKKFLPLIIFGLGALLFIGVFIVKSRGGAKATPEPGDDEVVAEIPFEKRPFVSLTPTADGHWLKLKIENMKVDGAATLDYLLEYIVADGRPQGTGGEIELEGENVIERELLLGSESSGKYRYDEGVEKGTLALRFRNDKGKLVGKLATDFHLQTGVTDLGTVDYAFTYNLNKSSKDYFVSMDTFGVPSGFAGEPAKGPFGIFASSTTAHPGSHNLDGSVSLWDGTKWVSLEDKDSPDLGVFISSK